MLRGTKPSSPELVSCAKPARAELPGLTPSEEVVLEQRVRLARFRAQHQPQPEQVPVDAAARHRTPCEACMRLHRTLEELETCRVLCGDSDVR